MLALLQVLKDKNFAEQTLSKYEPDAPPSLITGREVSFNVFWRFLHLRDYLDNNHQLTTWGKALEATISVLHPEDKAEELALIAIEMLRLNAINGTELSGGSAGKT